jgi:ABC-type nitrate/sulfonate/bicarbonate transport system substrate-binding protein
MHRRTVLALPFAALATRTFAPPLFGQSPLQKITINYPNRSGSNWPLFLAKDGGYYQKYGLDTTLVFGVHPAGIAMLVSGEGQMVNSSLDGVKLSLAARPSALAGESSATRPITEI